MIPASLGIDRRALYIGGEWIEGDGPPLRVDNPTTGEPLSEIRTASTAQVDRALRAAKKAQPAWGRKSYLERAQYLLKLADLVDENADELATLLALEVGKPLHSRGRRTRLR